ncbi:MAG: hypothetical protein AMXMBFR34_12320 [Myxococcaceae bacterium]
MKSVVTQWAADGTRESDYTFEDDLREGLERTWYENGQLRYKGTRRRGKFEGRCRDWPVTDERRDPVDGPARRALLR